MRVIRISSTGEAILFRASHDPCWTNGLGPCSVGSPRTRQRLAPNTYGTMQLTGRRREARSIAQIHSSDCRLSLRKMIDLTWPSFIIECMSSVFGILLATYE